MKKQKGFSLIELLIVVAIILVISAIAIPSYLRSRIQANEASAVSSLRMINTSAITYASTYVDVGYPASLANMGGALPWTGDGATPSAAYISTATPVVVGSSGQRMFCTDQSGEIHYDPSGAGCTVA